MAEPPWLVAEVGDMLANVGAPMYVLDRNGIVRWMNARAIDLLGDHRGSHFTSTIAPETQAKARLEFTKKMLGTARATDFEAIEVLRTGERVLAEIHSAAIESGGRVVGVFGIMNVGEPLPPTPEPTPADLTPRQHEVLRLLARGYSTMQIAEALSLSRETVRNHIRHLLHALRVNSRIGALAEGRRRRLID